MHDKYPDMDEEPNEKSNIHLVEHLVIVDADTGQSIINKRQQAGERKQ